LSLCLAGLFWQPVVATQGEVDSVIEVQDESAGEVDRASSGSAPAHEFRIEARMYRELLRQVMLDNRDRAVGEQFPQPMLLDMVRMSALLHSAAECKTGRVIVCPADLMQQLRSQQSRVTQGLEMLRMMNR
jgi:hypothetical protein